MIRIIKRCLSKSELTEHAWNFHPAFMHFSNYENVKIYRNSCFFGKPLKWYHILRKGDLIEVIEKPEGIVELLFAVLIANLLIHPFIALGVIGVIGLAVAGVAGAFSSKGTAAGASQKEYSSSTQPELSGASNDISSSIIPVLFGETQQTPCYGQLTYRTVGDGSSTNKLHLYFVPNYNNVTYSDFKLEDSSINNLSVDALDISIASGLDSFIGFDNVKAINVNEQLSYDDSGQVQQSNKWIYNQLLTATTIKVDFIIEMTNVSYANYVTKNFSLNVQGFNGVTPFSLTQAFAILKASLVLVSGTTYRYTGTITFTQTASQITQTTFTPTSVTRNNSYETESGLDCVYVQEVITAGTFVNTNVLNQSINYYVGTMSEAIQTSPANTTEIDVLISFPSGLYTLTSTGTRVLRSSRVTIQYREVNSSQWLNIGAASSIYVRGLDGVKKPLSSSTTTVSGATVTVKSTADMNLADQLFFRPIGFTVPKGKYAVRVKSADYADKTNYDVGYPVCAEIQFRVDGDVLNPIILPKVNQLAIEATAYKGLSGTLQKLNYVGAATIPICVGSNWDTQDKSTNPAAVIRYLLTDKLVNPRAISTDSIDNDTLVELYNWCEEKGFKTSGVIVDEVKISEILNSILSNCQAAMIPLYNGKHTFVIDKPGKIPLDMFGQHNSFDFKWYPTIGRQTTAMRASFLDNTDYSTNELTVYYWTKELLLKAGYSETEANELRGTISESSIPGTSDDDYDIVKKEYKYVNDRNCVLDIATYDLGTLQNKRNNFEFSVNLEALNRMLLDRVYVSNTTCLENESTGIIQEVMLDSSKTNIIGFRLYSEVEILQGSTIIIRSLDYANETSIIYTYPVQNEGLSEFVYIEPVTNNENIRGACEIGGLKDKWYYDGDLFTLGQGTIYDCTITDIKHNENFTATITCRDY